MWIIKGMRKKNIDSKGKTYDIITKGTIVHSILISALRWQFEIYLGNNLFKFDNIW